MKTAASNDQLNIAELQNIRTWSQRHNDPSNSSGGITYLSVRDCMAQEIFDLRAAQAPLVERIKELEKQNAELKQHLQTVTPEMIEAAEGIEDLYRRGTPNTWERMYRTMLKIALASSQGEQK